MVKNIQGGSKMKSQARKFSSGCAGGRSALRLSTCDYGNSEKIAYYIVPKIKYDDFDKEETSSSKIQHILKEMGNVDKNMIQKIVCLTYKNEIKQDDNNCKRNNDNDYYRFE